MGNVAKYNICKGVSTLLTIGTPIVTLLCYGGFFRQRSETAISAAGIFAILFAALFFKDKIAENFKCPSTLIISSVLFVIIILIENILQPIKTVCIATIIASGLDEVTFKRMYKNLELLFPENAKQFKHVGFIMCKTSTLMEEHTNEQRHS